MVRFHYDGLWYTVQEAENGCNSCIFDGERSAVCQAAGRAAVESGLPDCESRPRVHKGFIYRLDLSRGRQPDMFFTDTCNPRNKHGQKIPIEA